MFWTFMDDGGDHRCINTINLPPSTFTFWIQVSIPIDSMLLYLQWQWLWQHIMWISVRHRWRHSIRNSSFQTWKYTHSVIGFLSRIVIYFDRFIYFSVFFFFFLLISKLLTNRFLVIEKTAFSMCLWLSNGKKTQKKKTTTTTMLMMMMKEKKKKKVSPKYSNCRML